LKRTPSWLAVLTFGALLLLPGLGRLGALDSTDARYLAIGREMWATGDWLVPRLAGVPHLDKPPLTYWASSSRCLRRHSSCTAQPGASPIRPGRCRRRSCC
jgi:4-amino-4-deoxy-L-arabinose transferase-like glycosyltransferase